MRFLVLCASLLAGVGACKGDAPSNVDANPAGPRCNKADFDLCIEEHDCTSGLCKNFVAEGFQVCSKPCSTGAPCPNDSSGNPAICNADGYCQPAAPNMCHL